MEMFSMKTSNTVKKWVICQSLVLALGVAGAVHAGPKFSLDIEAFCGDPNAEELDMYGNVVNTFDENVAVRLTDTSDDNGPADPQVGDLTIECLTPVKSGRGKPKQETFATILIPDPGFGVIDATCPLGSLPEGATEWKARATASGGDVRREVSDNCEEIAAP
jgi:hypothetical protein